MNKPRINIFSLFVDILIDLALIGVGAAFYYQFRVYPLAPVAFSPVVASLFGGKDVAVLVISGVLIVVGLFNLFRTLRRIARGLQAASFGKLDVRAK